MQTELIGIISRFILMDTPIPIDFKILINLTFWGRAICEDARPRLFMFICYCYGCNNPKLCYLRNVTNFDCGVGSAEMHQKV